jgi:hypothetical protein
LTQSPLHAWNESPWNPERERENSKIADKGTCAHAILLERSEASIQVIDPADYVGKTGGVPTGWTNNAIREARDAYYAAGKTPILLKDMADIREMVRVADAFIASSEIAGLFDTGEAESTIIFDADGVRCKARPDWLTVDRKICLSYKTTPGSAAPDSWIRTQLPLYDTGIVLYERGVNSIADVDGGCRVVTLVQEQKPPYSCSLIGLAPDWDALAEADLSLALATWKSCLASGKFPAYPARICWAQARAWQLARQEERQQSDADEDGIPFDVKDVFKGD